MKLLRRCALSALLVVLAAGLAAPFLSAGAFKQRIRESLERALQRKVEITGKVAFNLFTGPGFSVHEVLIYDDPRAGIEPFAYVDSLEARVRLLRLLGGRLEFSTLRLVEPSVNLVKPQTGPWNIQPFLERTVAATETEAARLPEIQVRDGRLNFKFGDTKSLFYVTNADVNIYPASDRGEVLHIDFSGEPARTDRPAQGFGRFSARGQWRSFHNAESQVALSLQLEKSAIADISRLMRGRDIGLHGLVESRLRVSGPLSNLQIAGQMQIQDIHRWDLLPLKGEAWPLDYTGRLDLRAQRLELETSAPKESSLPVSLRFRASDLMSQLRWNADVTVQALPVASLLEVARHMGIGLPATLSPDGKLDGSIGFSKESGLQGRIVLRDASVQVPDAEPIRFEEAQLTLTPGTLQLAPATVWLSDAHQAEVEASYTPESQSVDLRISTRALAIRELLSSSGLVLGTAAVPLLENFREGTWRGWMRYQKDGEAPGEWTGAGELQDARVHLPGLADPLRVGFAAVSLQGSRVTVTRLRGSAGKTKFEGEYRYLPQAARPHRMRLHIAEADVAELERVLAPTLRRRLGFLARTLRLGRPAVPEWLSERHVDGAVTIDTLTAAESQAGPVRARLLWDGVLMELTDLEARQDDTVLSGRLAVNLSNAEPEYRMSGRLRDLAWRGGKIDAEGLVETFGTGVAVLENLRAEGSFQGQSVELVPDNEFRTLAGEYEFSFLRGAPRLRLSALQLVLGPETFSGQGGTQSDGRLQCDLSSGRKQVRIGGTLVPFKLEIAAR